MNEKSIKDQTLAIVKYIYSKDETPSNIEEFKNLLKSSIPLFDITIGVDNNSCMSLIGCCIYVEKAKHHFMNCILELEPKLLIGINRNQDSSDYGYKVETKGNSFDLVEACKTYFDKTSLYITASQMNLDNLKAILSHPLRSKDNYKEEYICSITSYGLTLRELYNKRRELESKLGEINKKLDEASHKGPKSDLAQLLINQKQKLTNENKLIDEILSTLRDDLEKLVIQLGQEGEVSLFIEGIEAAYEQFHRIFSKEVCEEIYEHNNTLINIFKSACPQNLESQHMWGESLKKHNAFCQSMIKKRTLENHLCNTLLFIRQSQESPETVEELAKMLGIFKKDLGVNVEDLQVMSRFCWTSLAGACFIYKDKRSFKPIFLNCITTIFPFLLLKSEATSKFRFKGVDKSSGPMTMGEEDFNFDYMLQLGDSQLHSRDYYGVFSCYALFFNASYAVYKQYLPTSNIFKAPMLWGLRDDMVSLNSSIRCVSDPDLPFYWREATLAIKPAPHMFEFGALLAKTIPLHFLLLNGIIKEVQNKIFDFMVQTSIKGALDVDIPIAFKDIQIVIPTPRPEGYFMDGDANSRQL